jgi:hypothetical protein
MLVTSARSLARGVRARGSLALAAHVTHRDVVAARRVRVAARGGVGAQRAIVQRGGAGRVARLRCQLRAAHQAVSPRAQQLHVRGSLGRRRRGHRLVRGARARQQRRGLRGRAGRNQLSPKGEHVAAAREMRMRCPAASVSACVAGSCARARGRARRATHPFTTASSRGVPSSARTWPYASRLCWHSVAAVAAAAASAASSPALSGAERAAVICASAHFCRHSACARRAARQRSCLQQRNACAHAAPEPLLARVCSSNSARAGSAHDAPGRTRRRCAHPRAACAAARRGSAPPRRRRWRSTRRRPCYARCAAAAAALLRAPPARARPRERAARATALRTRSRRAPRPRAGAPFSSSCPGDCCAPALPRRGSSRRRIRRPWEREAGGGAKLLNAGRAGELSCDPPGSLRRRRRWPPWERRCTRRPWLRWARSCGAAPARSARWWPRRRCARCGPLAAERQRPLLAARAARRRSRCARACQLVPPARCCLDAARAALLRAVRRARQPRHLRRAWQAAAAARGGQVQGAHHRRGARAHVRGDVRGRGRARVERGQVHRQPRGAAGRAPRHAGGACPGRGRELRSAARAGAWREARCGAARRRVQSLSAAHF